MRGGVECGIENEGQAMIERSAYPNLEAVEGRSAGGWLLLLLLLGNFSRRLSGAGKSLLGSLDLRLEGSQLVLEVRD